MLSLSVGLLLCFPWSIIALISIFNPMFFVIRMGSFHAEPPPPKQKIERQRKAPSKEAARIMPTQVAKLTFPWLQLSTCI